MIDFIPLEIYAKIFFNFLLFVVCIVFLQSPTTTIQSEKNLKFKNFLGHFVLIVSAIYVGFRPISGKYFADMERYASSFIAYADGAMVVSDKDVFFEYFAKFCSSFMDINVYFLTLVLLYMVPFYFVSKTFFKEYWFYAFLLFVASFSFWGSATNGIRNGIATSFFLFGVAQKKNYAKYIWMFLAISFHKSLMIPTIIYFITLYYKSSKIYLALWLFAIPLSLIAGGFFENFFLGFGFGDEDRLEGYLTELDEGILNAKVGFRWDFILYSATGVFAGYYYIFKKKFEDQMYNQIFNIYLTANIFWILIIKANFSNRFAYLSWFLLPLVIIYPLLKKELFTKHHFAIGKIILIYYMFTYVLNVILAP